MANIHGIRDLTNNEREHPAGNAPSREAELFIVEGGEMDPRKLSHYQTLQRILCPYFKCYSFLFITSVIQIFFYLTTVIYSLAVDKKLSPDLNSFLGPCTSTLVKFGSKVTCLITLSTLKTCN